MGVVNGTPVDAPTTNAAFISKNVDDTTSSNLGLTSAASASGASVTNTQREFNSIDSFTGSIINSAKNQLPVWVNNNVGTSTDNLKERCEALTAAFLSAGNVRAGTQSISTSSTSVSVTFSSAFASTSYAATCVIVNTVDGNPQFQPVVIVTKSSSGFTAAWDEPTDSGNYSLAYTAIFNV